MNFTKDEIKVIWLATHTYQPHEPEFACGLSEDYQQKICHEIRNKIFYAALDGYLTDT